MDELSLRHIIIIHNKQTMKEFWCSNELISRQRNFLKCLDTTSVKGFPCFLKLLMRARLGALLGRVVIV